MIIESMARELGLPASFVRNLSRGASHEYKTYQIPKRTGGTRIIHHPSKRLKALQRWLLAHVLERLPVHKCAVAYRKGSTILANAAAHVSSRYLLRMDIVDFFPSITSKDISNYVAARSALFTGWTPEDVDVFCRLVCRADALTIGAPTSPALSNAVCYDMDVLLDSLSTKNAVTYTRYADDLFFSTKEPNILKPLQENVALAIGALEIPGSLRINPTKTRHSSKRGARRVTGVTLGSDGLPHVGRALKRKIRALIHKRDLLSDDNRASLRGMIAYATGFDPHFMNALIAKYGLPAVRQATATKKS